MARPNFQHERRLRDLAKKKKQEEKRQRKQQKGSEGSTEEKPATEPGAAEGTPQT